MTENMEKTSNEVKDKNIAAHICYVNNVSAIVPVSHCQQPFSNVRTENFIQSMEDSSYSVVLYYWRQIWNRTIMSEKTIERPA